MSAGFVRRPWQVAGLAAVAAAAIAGCGASSASTPSASGTATSAGSAAASSASALSAVQLAAKTAAGASTVTGTMSVQATVKPGATPTPSGTTGTATSGDLDLTATFAEQLRPSLLASVDIGSLTSSGSSLPGGLSEILTPSTLYLKSSVLTQELHLSKPWIAIPLSQISKSSGINLSQILDSVNGNGPLTQSQLLAGATSVHQAGTSTLDGVPVTEYSGTLSLEKGLARLPSSTRTALQQAIAAEGLTTASFTVWIDGNHAVRKSVVTEAGKALTETITTTVTSLGKPVNIALPPASQTAPLPSGTTS
jgi:hypothetical protein